MAIIPKSKVEQVQWCEAHAPVWAAAPATMGLTAAQCTAFSALVLEARKDYDAAQAAKEAYHASITAQNVALSNAVTSAADLIRVIKGYAEQQADPNSVYSRAQIPPPAAPVPTPAPGKPTNISVGLNSDGSITLGWDADESTASTGAFFEITRKLPGQTAFTNLGGAPGSTSESRRMTFTDATIPTSAAGAGAQYIITGRRGTRWGIPSDAFVVQFGVDGLTVTGGTLAMAA